MKKINKFHPSIQPLHVTEFKEREWERLLKISFIYWRNSTEYNFSCKYAISSPVVDSSVIQTM